MSPRRNTARIDMEGQRFGRLVVRELEGIRENGHRLWRCRCDCGGEAVVAGNHLRSTHTESCGCLSVEHGKRIGAAANARRAAERAGQR